mmetsp:Transcript_22735/g.76359  ORF Transcript_22735/g.76359 Transcript_22735/m.76359 type:complete len:216 (+) Transcript_22735:2057-2704(+)
MADSALGTVRSRVPGSHRVRPVLGPVAAGQRSASDLVETHTKTNLEHLNKHAPIDGASAREAEGRRGKTVTVAARIQGPRSVHVELLLHLLDGARGRRRRAVREREPRARPRRARGRGERWRGFGVGVQLPKRLRAAEEGRGRRRRRGGFPRGLGVLQALLRVWCVRGHLRVVKGREVRMLGPALVPPPPPPAAGRAAQEREREQGAGQEPVPQA